MTTFTAARYPREVTAPVSNVLTPGSTPREGRERPEEPANRPGEDRFRRYRDSLAPISRRTHAPVSTHRGARPRRHPGRRDRPELSSPRPAHGLPPRGNHARASARGVSEPRGALHRRGLAAVPRHAAVQRADREPALVFPLASSAGGFAYTYDPAWGCSSGAQRASGPSTPSAPTRSARAASTSA